MKDQNDFFDDLINDEIEDDVEMDELDEPEDDEDDYPANVRTVVLLKNDMLALLGLKTYEQRGVIIRCDPREDVPSAQSYDDPAAAAKWFKRSLATSKKNGWSVVYDGEPLIG
ncbi:MAG TPA: hypothetical protein VGB17_02000 [Pyrinomonadaceae bacterium]|jgi:hypothetical protein